MRITRLYYSEKLNCGETTFLDASASSHLIRVLRTGQDATIILFNGDGFDYRCKTLDTNPKKTSVSIESKILVQKESNLSITLIQGLSRQDRMETTIQKSVELGVNKIIPVICQRSNYRLADNKKIKKLEYWRKVIISACEQSGRSVIPEITEITALGSINELLNTQADKYNLNPDAASSLKTVNNSQQAIELFIGPEGGLNDEETDYLKNNKFTDIRFGPRILRTETAGPAVISAMQMLWGDI